MKKEHDVQIVENNKNQDNDKFNYKQLTTIRRDCVLAAIDINKITQNGDIIEMAEELFQYVINGKSELEPKLETAKEWK